VHRQTGLKNLCLAGGVALNCVGNGRILRDGCFENVWIQPAAGDAGGAVGAALSVWHQYLDNPRDAAKVRGRWSDGMKGSYSGPEWKSDEIRAFLDSQSAVYRELDYDAMIAATAEALADEKVVGWMQGRMEFGPRALGNRSIVGDARSARMQSIMNLKIKYRESFRPFAPSCLEERVGEFFELEEPSPYMLLVAPVVEGRRLEVDGRGEDLVAWVNQRRSDVPAITHVDYSARIQTVHRDTNPRYHALIEAFHARTGCPLVVNTSFNVRGEPIVCTPEDAYRCFMRTEMDYLVLGSFLLDKKQQPEWTEQKDWRDEFALD